MDATDWRTKLKPETRQKVVKMLIDTLKMRVANPDLHQLQKIAGSFEERIYTAATSQKEYLQKISMKIMSMDPKFRNAGVANSSLPNSSVSNQNPTDPASHGMQSQLHNQGQLPNPFPNQSQTLQQLSSQDIQNTIPSSGVQSSTSLASALPSLAQTNMLNAVGQSSDQQNISGILHNSMGNSVSNSVSQGIPSNILVNSQKPMQGGQHPQQHQQKSPNPQQYMYQQPQVQHQILKQKLHQGNNLPSAAQSPIQQQQQQQHQNLLQPILQRMQPSMIQSTPHFGGLQQNQQPSVQHLTSSVRQQQQQQLGSPRQQSMQILQQPMNVSGQQQPSDASSGSMQMQGKQSQQSQPMHQQTMSRLQSQRAQLQQQPNPLQHDMQQRLQESGSLHQSQNVMEQKQLFQSHRTLAEASSTSMDSTAQTVDWQEEVFQKIKSLKEMYLPDLNEIYQKILFKCRQAESSPQLPKEQVDKFKSFKKMVESLIIFLHLPKSNITPSHREKLGPFEKFIPNFVTTHMPKKPFTSHQHGQQQLQSQSQIPQLPQHDNQMQSMNLQNSITSMHPTSLTRVQHASIPSLTTHLRIPTTQANKMNLLQPRSTLDSGQGNAQSSLQQGSAGLLQQNIHLKQLQEQQILQSQQMHQQQKQQQLHQPKKQQQQMPQLHQMSEDMKVRLAMGLTQGMTQQLHSGQPSTYTHQQLKATPQFLVSSPQLLQVASPQISQHSSPHLDPQSLSTPRERAGTPLQSVNSPFIVPSPSTPLAAPSPTMGHPDKQASGVSSLSNIGNAGQTQTQSLAIGTPGISASPLLVEFTSPEGNHSTASTIISKKSSIAEQPLERLINVVKSMSTKSLKASMSDIGSVISMIDDTAGSVPGNGSRAAIGEDLGAITKRRVQTGSFITHDGSSATKRMRPYTSGVPLNDVSSAASVNDSFKQLNGSQMSDLKSTATSRIKRLRVEASQDLLKEIRGINQRLIATMVDISDEDFYPTAAMAATEGGEGTIVKCSFNAVPLCPNLKSQYASAQMSQILPLQLLIPTNYPNCSPILLEKFPVELSKECEDLSVKVRSRFMISLRSLSQPMSLGEMVMTWDLCARAVVADYAQKSGGGCFSLRHGTWESCSSAA